MPDPIGPHSPSATTPPTIDLEPIVITASPSSAAPDAVDVGATAIACMDKINEVAVALLTAGRVNPYVEGLVGFGVGLDVAKCVAQSVNKSQEEASIHGAVTRCVEEGGTPLAVVEHELTCVVVVP